MGSSLLFLIPQNPFQYEAFLFISNFSEDLFIELLADYNFFYEKIWQMFY